MEKKRHGKSIARENAMHALYTYAITKEKKEKYCKDKMANEFVCGVVENEEEINELVVANLKKWTITQINQVNLAILQLSIYEIKFCETPNNIVVNEALNLAKEYSDLKSKNYIHATLDKITKG